MKRTTKIGIALALAGAASFALLHRSNHATPPPAATASTPVEKALAFDRAAARSLAPQTPPDVEQPADLPKPGIPPGVVLLRGQDSTPPVPVGTSD